MVQTDLKQCATDHLGQQVIGVKQCLDVRNAKYGSIWLINFGHSGQIIVRSDKKSDSILSLYTASYPRMKNSGDTPLDCVL